MAPYIAGASIGSAYRDSVTKEIFKVVGLYAPVNPCNCYFSNGGTSDDCYDTYPGPGILEPLEFPTRTVAWACNWWIEHTIGGIPIDFLNADVCVERISHDLTEAAYVRYWFSRKASDFPTSGLYTACCEVLEPVDRNVVQYNPNCVTNIQKDWTSMGGVVRPIELVLSSVVLEPSKRYKFSKCSDGSITRVLSTFDVLVAGDIHEWSGAVDIPDGLYENLGLTTEDIFTCTEPEKIYGLKLTNCETSAITHYKGKLSDFGEPIPFPPFYMPRPDGQIVVIGGVCYTFNYEAIDCTGAATLPTIGTITASFETCAECQTHYYIWTECGGMGMPITIKVVGTIAEGAVVRADAGSGLKCYTSTATTPDPGAPLIASWTVIPEGCESGICAGFKLTPCPNSAASVPSLTDRVVDTEEALETGDVIVTTFAEDGHATCWTVSINDNPFATHQPLPDPYDFTTCTGLDCPRVFELTPCDGPDISMRTVWTLDATYTGQTIETDFGPGLTKYSSVAQPSYTTAFDGQLPAWTVTTCP